MADYESILKDLHEAALVSFESLKAKCRELQLPPFEWEDFPVFMPINIELDVLVLKKLLPQSCQKDYVPLVTTGDGSCAYSAVSLLCCGDERRNTELRVRCIIELALHATYYLSDDDLLARIRAQEEFLTSSPCGEVSVQGAEVINKAYEQDVISTCSQGSYASMWQILALGAVVDRKVKSVYPLIAKTTAHSKVQDHFNATFATRTFDENQPPIALLWSRTDIDNLISSEDLQNFKPNHFVALMSKQLVLYPTWSCDPERNHACPSSYCSEVGQAYNKKALQSHYTSVHGGTVNCKAAQELYEHRLEELNLRRQMVRLSEMETEERKRSLQEDSCSPVKYQVIDLTLSDSEDELDRGGVCTPVSTPEKNRSYPSTSDIDVFAAEEDVGMPPVEGSFSVLQLKKESNRHKGEEDEIIRKKAMLLTLTGFDKALLQNIRKALHSLEGAWYLLYQGRLQSKMQKIQRLIHEGLEYLNTQLDRLSKITVSVAVLGPLGVGKSFVLNHLLSCSLSGSIWDTKETLLPSARGGSQTPVPVRIKFGSHIKISLIKEATSLSQLKKHTREDVVFGPCELTEDSLLAARTFLQEIFEDDESLSGLEYVELSAPFPVFQDLKSIIALTSYHPEVDVNVEFVDLPGAGDEKGDSLIQKELNKANIIMLFQAGQSGRPITAEDLAGVFRRHDPFNYPDRPKLLHVVNEFKESEQALPGGFRDRLVKKKADLLVAWNPLFERENPEDCYKIVLAKLPPLISEDFLQKMKDESDVIIFDPSLAEKDSFVKQLGEGVAKHVRDVQIKKEVHPVVEEMFRVTRRLRVRTSKAIIKGKSSEVSKEKNPANSKRRQSWTTPNLRIMHSEEVVEEQDILCNMNLELRNICNQSDIKEVNTQLCEAFFCQGTVMKHLFMLLELTLEQYWKNLLDEAENKYQLSLDELKQGYMELAEMLCRGRVHHYMMIEAEAFCVSTVDRIKKVNPLGKPELKKAWTKADSEGRNLLVPHFLKILLLKFIEFVEKPTRKQSLGKLLMENLEKDIKELVECNPQAMLNKSASTPKQLVLIQKKIDVITKFCRDKIREINPHPSLEGVVLDHTVEFPSLKTPKGHEVTALVSVNPAACIEKIAQMLLLKKPKSDPLDELRKMLKLPKGVLVPNLSHDVTKQEWAKILLNVLWQRKFFGDWTKRPLHAALQVERGNPHISMLFDEAKRQLFSYERSQVSCKLISQPSTSHDELVLKINDEQTGLEAFLTPELRQELNSMQVNLTDPNTQLAPIFIPTTHPGPGKNHLGNFFLEENPWGKETTEDEVHSDENSDETQSRNNGLGDLAANIFIVVEPRDLTLLKETMASKETPPGSNITLRYVVLPQNGTTNGITKTIIKILAECLKMSRYWTVDDNVKLFYQFNINNRRWQKCSFGRSLLFGQRVLQDCIDKAVNHLSEDETGELVDDVVQDKWPSWAKKTRRGARRILEDRQKFEEVLKNQGLLYSPFSEKNIEEDCGGDPNREEELRKVESMFVLECKKRLHKGTFKQIAGVAIAFQGSCRYDYVTKYAAMHYRQSYERYNVVLHNADALKGYSVVQDDIILRRDHEAISQSEKDNLAYWGGKGGDKSFCKALTFYGVLGYQLICIVHDHHKLSERDMSPRATGRTDDSPDDESMDE